jgi:2-dehydro-3-deoxygluconokinase
LHLTGITPALSRGCQEIVTEAVSRAKTQGLLVSFDVNYRSKLWTAAEASAVLWPLIEHVDLLICGEGDAETVFGLRGTPADILLAFKQRSEAKHIILTRSDQGSATLIDQQLVAVKARPAQVIDRLGAGDAFTAGVIDGWLDGDIVAGMHRGSILSALALAEHGDMMISDRQELEQLLE